MKDFLENLKLNFSQFNTQQRFFIALAVVVVLLVLIFIGKRMSANVLGEVTDDDIISAVEETVEVTIVGQDVEREVLNEFAKTTYAKKIDDIGIQVATGQKEVRELIRILSKQVEQNTQTAESLSDDNLELQGNLSSESSQRKAMIRGFYTQNGSGPSYANGIQDFNSLPAASAGSEEIVLEVSAFDVFKLRDPRVLLRSTVYSNNQKTINLNNSEVQNGDGAKNIKSQSIPEKKESVIDGIEKELDYRYEKARKPMTRVPAGTIFQAKLLAGVDTPTFTGSEETAFPALAVIVGDALAPNDRSYDFSGCHLLVGSYGSLSTERAYFRSTLLSCINEDNEIIEVSVRSYANGVDGKVGLRGEVVTKDSAIVAKAIASSLWQSIGSAITPAVNPQSLTQVSNPYELPSAGYVGRSLIGNGLSNAGDLLTKRYLDIAQNIFPVIEIQAGRVVEFVVEESFDINNVKESSDDE